MDAIRSLHPQRPDPNVLGGLQISQLSRASIDARSNTEISLVTADGDKVTLSAKSAVGVTHSTYDYLGRIRGQSFAAHAEKLNTSKTSALAITVQGDLNEEELADIQKIARRPRIRRR